MSRGFISSSSWDTNSESSKVMTLARVIQAWDKTRHKMFDMYRQSLVKKLTIKEFIHSITIHTSKVELTQRPLRVDTKTYQGSRPLLYSYVLPILCSYVLFISTSFWVLHASKSWLNYFPCSCKFCLWSSFYRLLDGRNYSFQDILCCLLLLVQIG